MPSKEKWELNERFEDMPPWVLKFISNYIKNGLKNKKDSAIAAGIKESTALRNANKILKHPACKAFMEFWLSHAGILEDKQEWYAKLRELREAGKWQKIGDLRKKKTCPDCNGTKLHRVERSPEVSKCLTCDGAGKIADVEYKFVPDYGVQMQAVIQWLSVSGQYAATKSEVTHKGDPFHGKTDEEKKALLEEAEDLVNRMGRDGLA